MSSGNENHILRGSLGILGDVNGYTLAPNYLFSAVNNTIDKPLLSLIDLSGSPGNFTDMVFTGTPGNNTSPVFSGSGTNDLSLVNTTTNNFITNYTVAITYNNAGVYLVNTIVGAYQVGETVSGQSSGQSGTFQGFNYQGYMILLNPTGSFTSSEVMLGSISAATSYFASQSGTTGDLYSINDGSSTIDYFTVTVNQPYEGITFEFGSSTGHTVGDNWTFTSTGSTYQNVFNVNPGGSTTLSGNLSFNRNRGVATAFQITVGGTTSPFAHNDLQFYPQVSNGLADAGGISFQPSDGMNGYQGSNFGVTAGNSDHGQAGSINLIAGSATFITGATGGNPGNINLTAGNSAAQMNSGGQVIIVGGNNSQLLGYGGNVQLQGGNAPTYPGTVFINGGYNTAGTGDLNGGNVQIQATSNLNNGYPGNVTISGGGGSSTIVGGSVNISAGYSSVASGSNGANVYIYGGSTANQNYIGGLSVEGTYNSNVSYDPFLNNAGNVGFYTQQSQTNIQATNNWTNVNFVNTIGSLNYNCTGAYGNGGTNTDNVFQANTGGTIAAGSIFGGVTAFTANMETDHGTFQNLTMFQGNVSIDQSDAIINNVNGVNVGVNGTGSIGTLANNGNFDGVSIYVDNNPNYTYCGINGINFYANNGTWATIPQNFVGVNLSGSSNLPNPPNQGQYQSLQSNDPRLMMVHNGPINQNGQLTNVTSNNFWPYNGFNGNFSSAGVDLTNVVLVTTLNQLAWVDPTANVNTTLFSFAPTMNAFINSFDSVGNGTIDYASAGFNLCQLDSSSTSGVIQNGIGVGSAVTNQSTGGSIDTGYCFWSVYNNATVAYGVFIDIGTTALNYFSGETQFGGTSMSPNATISNSGDLVVQAAQIVNLSGGGDQQVYADNLGNLYVGAAPSPNTFTLTDGNSTPTAITGLLINNASVQDAFIDYSIHFVSDTPASLDQVGTMTVTYDATNGWRITTSYDFDNTLTNFTIDGTGQIYYTTGTNGGTVSEFLFTWKVRSIQ